MISPKKLQIGDTVAIVSPAGYVNSEIIDKAVKTLSGWGLKVLVGENSKNRHHQFSGTDFQRYTDMQKAIDNPQVKAIFCSRGGYGSVRIIDKIDFTNFIAFPKWLIGFSDITVFHAHLHNFGVETLHAAMPKTFPDGIESLKKALFESENEYCFQPNSLNRVGKASGEIIGGNISIIASVMGSCSDFSTKGKILFLEDLCEDLYALDRMMQMLLRAKKLDDLEGLIVGGLSDMRAGNPPFGKTANEIISETVSEFD